MAVVVPNALALGSIADGSLMVASDERNNFTAVQVGVNGLIAMFAVAPTKGDLIVSAGGGAFDRVAVGANGQAIVADSSQPLGVKWATAPAARVFHNAAQSIASSATGPLAFNSERFDTDTIHDNVTNNSRLTCKTAGVYVISACVDWTPNASGRRIVDIFLNAATTIGRVETTSAAVVPLTQTVTVVYSLAVNDFVEVSVTQLSGGALNVQSSPNFSPEFSMVRVG